MQCTRRHPKLIYVQRLDKRQGQSLTTRDRACETCYPCHAQGPRADGVSRQVCHALDSLLRGWQVCECCAKTDHAARGTNGNEAVNKAAAYVLPTPAAIPAQYLKGREHATEDARVGSSEMSRSIAAACSMMLGCCGGAAACSPSAISRADAARAWNYAPTQLQACGNTLSAASVIAGARRARTRLG